MRDLLLALGHVQLAEERLDLLDGHPHDGVDVFSADRDGQRFGLQTRAATRRAGRRRHVLLDVFLDVLAARLGVPALQVVDDALERRAILPRLARARGVRKILLALGAVEHDVEHLVGELLDGRRQLDAVAAQHFLELLHVVRIHGREAAASQTLAPRNDRAVLDGLAPVGNHEPRIDLDLLAQTAARRARAVRRVERKQSRRQFLERESAIYAGEGLAKGELAIVEQHRHDAAGEFERGLDRIGQALANAIL